MDIKIIISPAKTFNNIKPSDKNRNPQYLKKSEKIKKILDSFSLQKIITKYKISERKAKEVLAFKDDKNTYPAIELFGGLVFKQLDLKETCKEWIDKHILIIDPLYGPLKPYDNIQKYRLDMKTPIEINLKEYWLKEVQKELKGFKVINLASKEYSDWIENIDLETPHLNKDIKQVKVARGIFLQKLIKANNV